YKSAYYQHDEKGCAPLHILFVRSTETVLYWIDKNDKGITAFATLVIAFFTFTLWWSTRVLADVGHRQSQDTRILQRAYLSVAPFGITPYLSKDGRLSCDVAIQNAGNLPAKNVRWFIDRDFDTDPAREAFVIDRVKRPPGDNVIPPKGEMRKGAPHIEASELDAKRHEYKTQNEVGWLYVWGRVEYHDGFSPDRFIEFCHRYSLAGTGDTIDKVHGRQHEYGNRTEPG